MVSLTTYETELLFWNLIQTPLFPVATCKCRLYQNNIVPTPQSVVGDFTEATFTGYTEATFQTNGTTGIDPVTGRPYVNSAGTQIFAQSGTGITNTVYGWYIVDTANSRLLLAGRFDAPYLMNASGKQIVLFFDLQCGFAETDTALLP